MSRELQDWQTPRPCMVCGEDFIPYRKSQKFCPKPKRCVHTAKGRAIAHDENALLPTICECGASFTPWQTGQKRCGMTCPGKPKLIKVCGVPWCDTEFTPASRVGNRQKYCSAKCSDRAEIITNHGITVEKYAEMWEAQGGVCAICGTHEPGKGAGRGELHVDHDHMCCPGQKSCGECVRGLTCFHCNVGMGIFKDDPNRLVKTAAYIMNYQTKQAKKLKEKPVFVAK